MHMHWKPILEVDELCRHTSVGPVAVKVVVGLGPSKQEHPLEPRDAGYWLTNVGNGSSSSVTLFG